MSEEAEATPEVTTEVPESLPSDWVQSLPEELRDAPGLRPLKDGTIRTPAEARIALDNFAQLQGNMTETHIRIPSNDAADADKQSARERILSLWPDLREVTEGEDTIPPDDVAGYKLPEGADVLDAAVVADIAKFAIEHKWGQGQFADYAARMIGEHTTSQDRATQWQKDQGIALDGVFGAAKAERIARVASAMEQSGASPEYIAAIKEGNVDAALITVVDNLVGKMVAMGDEGSQFVQQVKADAQALTPTEHKIRANELWRTLQDVHKDTPEFDELNRKRMEHIGLSMQTG